MPSDQPKRRWIPIGVVGKPYGLRGAFYLAGRDSSVAESYSEVAIGHELGTSKVFNVDGLKDHKGRTTMTLEGVADRTTLELLVGQKVWADAAEIDLDESHEYLWSDLIGKEVVVRGEDQGKEVIGSITDVFNYGASDIVRIESSTGGALELPFVSQYFDMAFRSDDAKVFLVVGKSHFEELWGD